MADEKLNTGPAENISPEAAEPITTPEQAAAAEPQQEQTGPAIPESGDVVVSFDKINELMAEKRQNARAEVEKAETPETPEAAAPGETPQPANTEEPKKPRRGRPPKAEKAATENQKAEKSAGARKGRPPKADKAAPDKPKPSKRDKVSRSDGKAPDAKEPIKPAQDTAPKETAAAEQTAPEPTTPPRPVEEGKLVYLKLSEVHPLHTFRPHPFKVRDDAKMQEIVASIRVNGVMVPGLARPEKDGNGYEIVAGHRRTHGSELAGLEEMPFIVREMTDHEAVQAMKDSNKQRDGMLPSELAALLELEVEDIKHQGGRLKGIAEGDVGKRSVEIVGEAHEMNYKKVMRYLRLNSLVPELLDKVDDKKMGFMPAVELSYIKPKNQRLIAVSIDGEQASPSLAQAKRLRELDKEGKLNGDVIDGILSEQKKEDRGVIISTAELEKYFGKEVTPAKMKEQIALRVRLAFQANLHKAAVGGAVSENKALIQKLAERADAGGRKIDCQRHKLPTAQQIQHPHILAGFAAAVAGTAKLAQRTGRTGATGFTVALFAVHRGAKRRYIVVVLITLRPVGAACMVVQNHPGECGTVIWMLRIAVGNLELQHSACGNLDAGKRHCQAVPILGKFFVAELSLSNFGQHKVQRLVGGHGGGGCDISVHHRHNKSSCVYGQHQAVARLILDHCREGMVKIL